MIKHNRTIGWKWQKNRKTLNFPYLFLVFKKNINKQTFLKHTDGNFILLRVTTLGTRIWIKEDCCKVSQETSNEDLNAKGLFVYYVRKILRKINISSPLIRTPMYAYQGVRNVCLCTKLMIPSGSTNYDDRSGNNDNNNSNNDIVVLLLHIWCFWSIISNQIYACFNRFVLVSRLWVPFCKLTPHKKHLSRVPEKQFLWN